VKSIILRTASPVLVALLSMFSLYMLLRGHDQPGGGFIGGLMVSAALALDRLPHGPEVIRRMLRIDARTLIGIGLLLLIGAGAIGLLAGAPFLTGAWLPFSVSTLTKLGTPLLFDIGVYIVVVGAVQLILSTLSEE
jgi:multicomponent Na+:H+ antiporter subunit B